MIQMKYNRHIYDEGTNEAIERLSHLRANALMPVGIGADEDVFIFGTGCDSIKEWLTERAKSLTSSAEITGKYDAIITMGSLTETPSVLKQHLKAGGRLVFAFSDNDMKIEFLEKLLKEADITIMEKFRLCPDYLFTEEIYAEDYFKGGAGDYLLVAR